MGVVTQVFPSEDDIFRKLEVRVVTEKGKIALYTRPISELVLLVEAD